MKRIYCDILRSIEQDNQFSFAVGEGDPACFAQDCTHNSPLVSINGKHTGDDSGLFLCKGQSESLTEAEDPLDAGLEADNPIVGDGAI